VFLIKILYFNNIINLMSAKYLIIILLLLIIIYMYNKNDTLEHLENTTNLQ